MGVIKDFFNRLFKKDDSTEWCLTYLDVNSFRRDRVMSLLKDSGLDVRPSSNSLLVKQEEFTQAMNVLKKHGY